MKAMRFIKKWLPNVALVFFSLLVFFGIAEVATRMLWKQEAHGLYQVLPDQMHLTSNTEASYKSSEFEFKVTSNRFGRRDWEWTDAVMKDPGNIVFVGDSFVLGYGVNDPDTVPTA